MERRRGRRAFDVKFMGLIEFKGVFDEMIGGFKGSVMNWESLE